jgi:hypothetical protein
MSIRIISSGSIEGRSTQVRTNLGQVDEPIDLAQQMIVRDMPLKTEAVEQRLLHHPPLAHHRPNLLHPADGISGRHTDQAEFFNAIRKFRSFPTA